MESCNTIFVELEYPRELLVIVRVNKPNSYNPYEIYTIEYGHDLVGDFDDNEQFEVLPESELSELFTDRRRYEYDLIKERIVQGFRHKNDTIKDELI